MAFPFLTIFMIFIIFLFIRFTTLNKKQEETYNNFWDKEQDAENTPTKDISNLPYIKIPLSSLPMGKWDDDEIRMIEDNITELSTKRILNLTGKTNTELKLEYGTANLNVMSEIGENYNELTILLTDYGKALMQKGDYDSAASVFEYGAAIKSDVSSNYMLLGDCYIALHQARKIEAIKEQVLSMHLLLEYKIISYLDSLTPNTEDFEMNTSSEESQK
ncbi:MAG: hypothetical protein K6F30_06210 [Lachnospiraceae bacterium]|nr:hypothetical protein [Lachnospiraceae bacterium]